MKTIDSVKPAPIQNYNFITNIKYYDIYVDLSDGKGMGLFSKVSIPRGVTIAESIARRIQACARSLDPAVAQYLFVDPSIYCGSRQIHDSIIVCSELTLLNHSGSPNSRVVWEEISTELLLAKLISIREILASEEITIFYTDADSYEVLQSQTQESAG